MKAYPKTQRAIVDMIDAALLRVPTARAIRRRSGLRVGSASVTTEAPPDLSGQFSKVEILGGGTHSQYGTVHAYTGFADGFFLEFALDHFADFTGITEARIVANVTEAGVADSSLTIAVEQDVEGTFPAISFTGGAPAAPLDSVALHVTDWRAFEWEEAEEIIAKIYWKVSNPFNDPGNFGLGLCQIQVRGAS